MKKTTMQDIADVLGVSKMTISKCFQNSDDISTEMKSKILKVAGEMGYVYQKQVNYNVAVLVLESFLDKEEAFYSGLYKKLNEIAGLGNLTLTLNIVKKNALPRIDYSAEKYDGFIVMGQLPLSILQSIISLNIPLVCVDCFYRNIHADTIVCNNYTASYKLTAYLIDRGHRNIGFVGNLNVTNSINDRFFGFCKALMEADIPITNTIQIDDRDADNHLISITLPSELPTAFVCNNDHVAYLLIRQLQKAGYTVPADISVVGFDDVIYSIISDPPITTMRVAITYIAEQAVKLIVRRIKNRIAEPRMVSVECRMIERESVSAIQMEVNNNDKMLG